MHHTNRLNLTTYGFGLIFLLFMISACKSKKVADNPLTKYLTMENPYLEINRTKAETYGYGEMDAALRDSILLCYDLLEKNDEKLKPIIYSLVSNNPKHEGLLFIQGKNHMNQENYARAIEIFSSLKSSGNYEIKDQSRYYYALLVLYLDSKDPQALSIFQDISNDEKSEFQYHAKDIISYM